MANALTKLAALLFLLIASRFAAAANDESMPPMSAIRHFGAVTISDGSSYYTFSKDGSFTSGPLGMSGREFKGRWTQTGDGTFTVLARLGWMNGSSTGTDYRRIVFVIYNVRKRPPETKSASMATLDLFDSYFIIDELVKIPKPGGSELTTSFPL